MIKYFYLCTYPGYQLGNFITRLKDHGEVFLFYSKKPPPDITDFSDGVWFHPRLVQIYVIFLFHQEIPRDLEPGLVRQYYHTYITQETNYRIYLINVNQLTLKQDCLSLLLGIGKLKVHNLGIPQYLVSRVPFISFH